MHVNGGLSSGGDEGGGGSRLDRNPEEGTEARCRDKNKGMSGKNKKQKVWGKQSWGVKRRLLPMPCSVSQATTTREADVNGLWEVEKQEGRESCASRGLVTYLTAIGGGAFAARKVGLVSDT